MPDELLCPFCNTEVNPNQKSQLVEEVTGWRAPGKASKVENATGTGRWAHKGCLKASGGGPPAQDLERAALWDI